MSAADKRLKDKAEKRLKAKPKKAENQKRVCQKFMTHPLFLFHQSFFFMGFTSPKPANPDRTRHSSDWLLYDSKHNKESR